LKKDRKMNDDNKATNPKESFYRLEFRSKKGKDFQLLLRNKRNQKNTI
jgi:hypothetical protein